MAEIVEIREAVKRTPGRVAVCSQMVEIAERAAEKPDCVRVLGRGRVAVDADRSAVEDAADRVVPDWVEAGEFHIFG